MQVFVQRKNLINLFADHQKNPPLMYLIWQLKFNLIAAARPAGAATPAGPSKMK